jgi:hypothetical protein
VSKHAESAGVVAVVASFYGDRRDLIGGRFETRIDVDIGCGSRGSKCGRGAKARARRDKQQARSDSSLMRFSVKRSRNPRQGKLGKRP